MHCLKFIVYNHLWAFFGHMGTFNHYSFVTLFFLYLYPQVLAKLEKFKTTKLAKETPTTVESKHASGEELSDWRSVSLKFSTAAGKVSFLFPYFMI